MTANIRPVVVFAPDMKSATVVAVNGAKVEVIAQDTLAVWFRKDGGVTFRTDAAHRSQTIRVDQTGRVFNTLRDTFAKVPFVPVS